MPCSLNVWGLDVSSWLRKEFLLSFDLTVPNSSGAVLSACVCKSERLGRNKELKDE